MNLTKKLRAYTSISAPLISIFILMNGLGLFSTFVPIRLEINGVSPWSIGIITACYYLGMALGAFNNATFILRVGHIRAFSAFAALATVSVLLNGIFDSVWCWALFRGIGGYCLAGLYIVIESWILKESKVKTRGQFLALYMIAIYGASASGQFLLNISAPNTLIPFIVISVLTSLSIIPLAITKVGTPIIDEPSALNFFDLFKLSPSGLISCTASGLLVGSVSGFLPLYMQSALEKVSDTAFVMFLVLLGSMALQYPVGKVSDQFDRRKVIISLCAFITVTSLSIIMFSNIDTVLFYILMFVFGGVSFALYPVSISHTCDVLKPNDIVAATQGLMLAYGIGAVLGPLIIPIFMSFFGHNGVFIYFTAVCSILGLYLLRRIVISDPTALSEHQDFVAFPSTTPVAAELDPRADE